MGNLRPFQIALLGIFGILAVLSIYFIRVYQPTSNDAQLAYGNRVSIWGSFEPAVFDEAINDLIYQDKAFSAVTYTYVDERSFDDQLVNAIAEGRSPDVIILRSDSLVKHRAKLLPIPYDSFPLRTFKDSYVEAAELFARTDGVYAIPFLVDPLVMYWNRDLFSSAGIAQAPSTWESLVGTGVPALTMRDTSRNILQSALAFGEYQNITNAKNILLALAMQSGSQLVQETDAGSYDIMLNETATPDTRPPFDATLQFYTDFSNSNSPLYTWNRAQVNDKNAFISQDLAIYFGLGSELKSIADKNPNLNFDIAPIPQGAAATVKRTSAAIYGFAIPRASTNQTGAYAAALTLSQAQTADFFAQNFGMAAPHRSIVNAGDVSPYRQIILQSALISRGWLDPRPTASDTIFLEMVEDVVSNRERVSTAVSDALRRLSVEY